MTVLHKRKTTGPHQYGPKPAGDKSIGEKCPACGESFREGDYTALIPLGPGANTKEQRAARDGKVYNAVAVEVHIVCATGEGPQ